MLPYADDFVRFPVHKVPTFSLGIKLEEPRKVNKIRITGPEAPAFRFQNLNIGDMFTSVFPQSETNVYMKLGVNNNSPQAVLLKNGAVYTFQDDKEVIRVRADQQVILQQGN